MVAPDGRSCSVVLATLAGWKEIGPLVGELARQAESVGGEVIVGDGSAPAAIALTLPDPVVWFRRETAGIFALRHEAVRRASGDVGCTSAIRANASTSRARFLRLGRAPI
jgi:hypothetical protein